MRAVQLTAHGGPSAITLVDRPPPEPGPRQIRVRADAIGVNFIDTYHRSGLYPLPLPHGLGLEAAGTVDAVGEGVTRFNLGDRVGYCAGPPGAYAEAHVVFADQAVALPTSIDPARAAAAMLKGMTARYLCKRTFRVERGQWIVVHAAAGGVGQILTQWVTHLGGRVIAVVSTEEKAAIARALGAEAALLAAEPLAERVRAITGEGAACVYDGVGRATWEASLESLAPTGMLVSYGNASGPPPPIDPLELARRGSLFLTRPTLGHYTRTPELLQETADDLFEAMLIGVVEVAEPKRYPLEQAARAHIDLESRATTGSLVLIP